MITLESSTEVQRKQLEPGDSLALQNTRGLNINTTDFKSEIDETSKSRLRRIGNQRPDVFSSIWEEIGFVFSISMSQILSVTSVYPDIH